MKTYLLIYDPDVLVDWVIPEMISRNEKIGDAYSFFGNAVCIKTESSIKYISGMLRKRYPDLQFVVVELGEEPRAGTMPQIFWDFLKEQEFEKSAV